MPSSALSTLFIAALLASGAARAAVRQRQHVEDQHQRGSRNHDQPAKVQPNPTGTAGPVPAGLPGSALRGGFRTRPARSGGHGVS
jgi:hypothetical protein